MKYKVPFLYLSLLVLVGVASIVILDRTKPLDTHIQQNNSLDSFVVHGTYTEYNATGQIRATLTAKKITHFTLSKKTFFTHPFIITYTDDRTPIHIHANRGIANSTGEKIILLGHVIIQELPTAKTLLTTITTSALTIFPKTSRATTQKAVTIKRVGTLIQGVGLDANLKTGQYQLHSKAKAIYQFPSDQKSHKE